jgi:hypothetical protein
MKRKSLRLGKGFASRSAIAARKARDVDSRRRRGRPTTAIAARTNGCSSRGTGTAISGGKRHPLRAGTLLLIGRGERSTRSATRARPAAESSTYTYRRLTSAAAIRCRGAANDGNDATRNRARSASRSTLGLATLAGVAAETAHTTFVDGAGRRSARRRWTQTPSGVLIELELAGLAPG